MKNIQLTQGKIALVSDHRYEYLSQWKWIALRIKKKWYAVRRGSKGESDLVFMHRFITNAPDKMDVDHIDNDGLNCQDQNLRVCTRSQNLANRGKLKNNTSGFKGVYLKISERKWIAQISYQGRKIHIGRFDNPVEAAHAYDKKALELYGQFALINFPI